MLFRSVVGKTTDAVKYKSSAEFIVAIGDNLVRERLQVSLEKMNFTLTKLIHPTAIIGTDVAIGDGTVVAAGVVINSSSRIGKGCIINTHSSLDHDNCLGDFVHISPGACLTGTVNIGSRCWIGSGVVINNNLSICEDCIIGSGGVVVSDITLPGTYIGVPVMRIHC